MFFCVVNVNNKNISEDLLFGNIRRTTGVGGWTTLESIDRVKVENAIMILRIQHGAIGSCTIIEKTI